MQLTFRKKKVINKNHMKKRYFSKAEFGSYVNEHTWKTEESVWASLNVLFV